MMNTNFLNDKQREAIYYNKGPLMILAGAGSGKTGVITHKIAYLISKHNINPMNILGVTFTNKASNEMKERISGILGKKFIRGLSISTFHALCAKLLRKEGHHIGFKNNFTIMSESDQLSNIKQIFVDLNVPLDITKPEVVLSLISRAKNQLLFPRDLKNTTVMEGSSELVINVYEKYQSQLMVCQSMDFDDLLLYMVHLLKNNQEISDKYRKRFQYILVDEYQDTNYAQYELIKCFTKSDSNISIVGDDDQSIYSWRGAESSNFQRFEVDYHPVKTVILDQNYRSTGAILKSASAIISKNSLRKPKSLWSDKGIGELIHYYECSDESDEAYRVVDRLFDMKFRGNQKYHDFAILYRTNFQSRPFELVLRERDIPYRLVGGISFFDRKEIKDLIAYLKVINNNEDDISLLRIINYPRRGIGESTIEALRNFAMKHKLSLLQAMEKIQSANHIDLKSQARIMEFVDMIHQFKKEYHYNPIAHTTKRLIEYMDYESALYKLCKDDGEWQRKLENIKDFIKSIHDYETKQDEREDDGIISLSGYLNNISLMYEGSTEEDENQFYNKVTLLTLHSSKGLEFPHVFLVGMEEGIIPHGNNENLEEERRLCYVGFTRAMKTLTLTSCKTRKKYGSIESRIPSRFLEDIPPQYLNQITSQSQPDLTNEEATDYFSQMKGLLKD